jgi:outer membrane lipoprotein-sorting protein
MRTAIRLLLLICLTLGAVPAAVPAAVAAALSELEIADIARAEAYLNTIQTMRARFIQVGPQGGLTEGNFYLRRPGRLRFEYDPPIPVLVVADGTWVVFYDSEINQVTRLPLGSTPLAVLLRDEVRLRGSVTVTDVERATGTLRITVIDTEAPDQGTITLVFNDRPLALRQWLIRDPQGLETSIAMSQTQFNLILEPQLFVFFEPIDEYYR